MVLNFHIFIRSNEEDMKFGILDITFFQGETADLKSKSTIKYKSSSKYLQLRSSTLNYEKSMPHCYFSILKCIRPD